MLTAGIDAGGSKTECIIVDSESSTIITRAQTGPANYQVVGLKKACQEIKSALDEAKAKAGISKLSVIGLGIAGAGRENDKIKLRKELNQLIETEFFITDDAQTAFLGATGGEAGIVLIAGTGSIAYGLKKSGHKIRSGGWGPLIGDEGSGFWIALEAIKKTVKANENRAEATKLEALIIDYFNLDSLQELIPFIYGNELPRREIAALTPKIMELAENGDKIAAEIIEEALSELSLLANSLTKRLDYQENKIFAVGGLFKSSYFLNLFKNYLKENYDLQTLRPKYSAAYGAVFFALEELKKNN
ncbi:MAG: N-acetylglucosamine kinase [Halanaerobium sp.]